MYAGIRAARQFSSGCARYKSRYILAWSVKGEGCGGLSFRVSKCVVLVVFFYLDLLVALGDGVLCWGSDFNGLLSVSMFLRGCTKLLEVVDVVR